MKTKELKTENEGRPTRDDLAFGVTLPQRLGRAFLGLFCWFTLPSAFCAFGQGTAFTYQGQLNLNGAPANGNYDFEFVLFNTNQFGFPAAPLLTNASVSVNNGLFTTALDFGGGIFTGSNFWLDISVRTNGNGTFADLSPRQPIAPTPYAITAANLAGVVENNTIQTGVALGTIGGGGGNSIQTGASFATVGGGGNNVIQSGADHSTIGGGSGNNIATNAYESFVGGGQNNYIYAHWATIGGGLFNTIQTNADDSIIGGGEGNTIQTNASESMIGGGVGNIIQQGASISTIAGGNGNVIQTNAQAATIGGGYQNTIQSNALFATVGGGYANVIAADTSSIGGGYGNVIYPFESFIGGGQQHVIGPGATWSVIGGGLQNSIQTNASYSMIGGGQNNQIGGAATQSTVGGGGYNLIGLLATGATIGGGSSNQSSGTFATVGGGENNSAVGNTSTIGGGLGNTNSGSYATIPGGYGNLAAAAYSFAAGRQAQALHQGAFVWGDSQASAFSSSANDQFLVRANGGVGINNNNPGGASLRVVGNRTGGWTSPIAAFENTSGAAGSSPALRVVVDGGSAPDGALNVSDNGTGPIAEFGNGIGFVASIENDGTIKSKGVVLTSDRNAKENFASLNAKMVLAKVTAMPVTEWNYKDDGADKKHIGPVAQDFYAAFGLNGTDDKHISVVDEGGVALAAIQGLNQKVEEQRSELKQKQSEIAELKMRLEKLEQIMKQGSGDAK